MKQILVKCYTCGKEFLKLTKEVDRQLKNGKNKFYCSRLCLSSKIHLSSKYKEIEKQCLFCGKKFVGSNNPKAKKTCSTLCAGRLTYKNTTVEYKQSREKNKPLYIPKRKKFIFKNQILNPDLNVKIKTKIKYPICNIYKNICIICNKLFFWKINKKTCSEICYNKHMSNIAREHPNCGGETNYKRYRYKNILMDSSWEVDLAVWLDSKNIKWERSKKLCLFWLDQDNNKRRYYPDFYLPDYDLYLDPKNKFLEEKDKYKIESVIKINNVKIIYGNLNKIKEYIENFCNNLDPHSNKKFAC